MTIEYLGVSSDFTGSSNSLNLRVRGDLPLTESCKILIERPGQNSPYLAENGWQSNYKKCLIDVVPSAEGDFDLCLPLSFAQYLDSEHNYKVELFDLSDESVGIFGMNWTPPPKIRAMRIEPVVQRPAVVDEDQPEPEPEPVKYETVVEPYEAPRPRVVDRKVRNCVRCRGQIFSTFTICPYCGTPVTQD